MLRSGTSGNFSCVFSYEHGQTGNCSVGGLGGKPSIMIWKLLGKSRAIGVSIPFSRTTSFLFGLTDLCLFNFPFFPLLNPERKIWLQFCIYPPPVSQLDGLNCNQVVSSLIQNNLLNWLISSCFCFRLSLVCPCTLEVDLSQPKYSHLWNGSDGSSLSRVVVWWRVWNASLCPDKAHVWKLSAPLPVTAFQEKDAQMLHADCLAL